MLRRISSYSLQEILQSSNATSFSNFSILILILMDFPEFPPAFFQLLFYRSLLFVQKCLLFSRRFFHEFTNSFYYEFLKSPSGSFKEINLHRHLFKKRNFRFFFENVFRKSYRISSRYSIDYFSISFIILANHIKKNIKTSSLSKEFFQSSLARIHQAFMLECYQ